jgi:hypothetical protein
MFSSISLLTQNIQLLQEIPSSSSYLSSKLPGKRLLGNFRPTFIEERRLKLQEYLTEVVSNPETRDSEALGEFINLGIILQAIQKEQEQKQKEQEKIARRRASSASSNVSIEEGSEANSSFIEESAANV